MHKNGNHPKKKFCEIDSFHLTNYLVLFLVKIFRENIMPMFIYIKGTVSGTSSDLTAVEVEARLSNVKDRGGSRRKRKHSPDEVAQAGGAVAMSSPTDESTSSSPIDPLSDLYAVLEGSALIPFLESKLQANSFLEICSHATVYRYVVHIIRELGKI